MTKLTLKREPRLIQLQNAAYKSTSLSNLFIFLESLSDTKVQIQNSKHSG